MRVDGIEPSTLCLKGTCSTTELHPHSTIAKDINPAPIVNLIGKIFGGRKSPLLEIQQILAGVLGKVIRPFGDNERADHAADGIKRIDFPEPAGGKSRNCGQAG